MPEFRPIPSTDRCVYNSRRLSTGPCHPNMFDVIRKKLRRAIVLASVFFLPQERKRIIERKLRGQEENRKLGLADWVLVSWGKSGRTWFRMMISRIYQVKFGLKGKGLTSYQPTASAGLESGAHSRTSDCLGP